MHVFGLTGGIASGKSTVADRFREQGVPILDADDVAREVVVPGSEGLTKLVEVFGSDICANDGSLDRKKLGSIVFADAAKRKLLNAIVHPLIGRASAEHFRLLAETGTTVAGYEAALLFENGLADAFRPVVLVTASPETQIERTMRRDHTSRESAEARINTQMPLSEKRALADIVIENSGSRDELFAKTDIALREIRMRLGVL